MFGNFSLFKTLFLGQDSLPRMELPPYLLCLFFHLLYFSYLFLKTMICFSGCTTGAPSQADDRCPEPQEVLANKPVCSLVVNVSLRLLLPPSGPSSSGCLSLEGDGLQLADSVPSFVLCVVLVVSYIRAFCMVAIPQSGLLAQVSSFWLCMGHSCPILKKHCSPRLPAQLPLASGGCRHLYCFSSGGVTDGLIICWF